MCGIHTVTHKRTLALTAIGSDVLSRCNTISYGSELAKGLRVTSGFDRLTGEQERVERLVITNATVPAECPAAGGYASARRLSWMAMSDTAEGL